MCTEEGGILGQENYIGSWKGDYFGAMKMLSWEEGSGGSWVGDFIGYITRQSGNLYWLTTLGQENLHLHCTCTVKGGSVP